MIAQPILHILSLLLFFTTTNFAFNLPDTIFANHRPRSTSSAVKKHQNAQNNDDGVKIWAGQDGKDVLETYEYANFTI